MSCSWQLKGNGAANLVFAYCGNEPNLCGHVLRVRKLSAHVASAVDRALWDSVLNTASGSPIEYELAYMAKLMAPLLGREHVFPGVPSPVPEELRSLLGYGDADGATSSSSLPGLILPDHTTFQSGVPSGYTGAGSIVCLEIKPKWGLDPRTNRRGGQPSAHKPAQGNSAAATAETQLPADAAAAATAAITPVDTGAQPMSAAPPAGYADCDACEAPGERAGNGVLSRELQLDPEMYRQQQYPRFLLHMLYKHVKHGVAVSHYNPLDLFSGQLDRMQRALWSLLRSPSNNLAVFRDGVRVYGTSVKAPAHGNGISNGSIPPPPLAQLRRQQQQQLRQLAAKLQGFVETTRPAGGARVAEPVAAAEAEKAASSKQEQHMRDGTRDHEDVPASLDTLVRLTALALHRDGLLGRLHSVQAMDQVGPEGALKLYHQLLEEIQGDGNGDTATALAPGAQTGSSAAAANIGNGRGASDWAAVVAAATGSDTPATALRRYLLSATAKDCGIMVTLQRAVPAAEAGAPADAIVPPAVQATGDMDSHAGPQQPPHTQQPLVRLLADPHQPGVTYMVKVAFVDLDLKAVAKIPRHVELERDLLACAREHPDLLRQLGQQAGWM